MLKRLMLITVISTGLLTVAGCKESGPTTPTEGGGKQDPAEMTLSLPTAATDAIGEKHLATAGKLINGGVAFFLSQRQDDGGWSMARGANKPAITAMVLKALVQHPDFGIESPVVTKGFEVLLSYQQPDGGIYNPKEGMSNYTTAVAVMAMAASQDPKYTEATDKAVKYLKGLQILPGSESPDGTVIDEKHPFVGGVSYGKHERPDLSNLGMWMQALKDAGVESDDPHMQRALLFVERCQNRSESNPMPWAKEGSNDGGSVYAVAIRGSRTEGESKSGDGPGGRGLRSYGSMTYVMFKSMLYAGVDREDGRVKAAFAWIRRYWRLDSNPNMPQTRSQEGLFYYYHMFAKALRAWGEPIIKDTDGAEHNWREELIDALAERVGKDGSWVNEGASRWEEGSAVLSTAYSVLALEETLKK